MYYTVGSVKKNQIMELCYSRRLRKVSWPTSSTWHSLEHKTELNIRLITFNQINFNNNCGWIFLKFNSINIFQYTWILSLTVNTTTNNSSKSINAASILLNWLKIFKRVIYLFQKYLKVYFKSLMSFLCMYLDIFRNNNLYEKNTYQSIIIYERH